MPKVAYSEEERERIRKALITTGLDLMSKQGIQHTTVEQIYKAVGISRTFFYSFFPTKEELIVEVLYLQQPQLISYAKKLKDDPTLSWRNGLKQLFHSLCHSKTYGIIVLTIEEQQLIFKRLSEKNYEKFREKQFHLFDTILKIWGLYVNTEQLELFINLSVMIAITYRGFQDTFPLLIPDAVDATVNFQIEAMLDYLEILKRKNSK